MHSPTGIVLANASSNHLASFYISSIYIPAQRRVYLLINNNIILTSYFSQYMYVRTSAFSLFVATSLLLPFKVLQSGFPVKQNPVARYSYMCMRLMY